MPHWTCKELRGNQGSATSGPQTDLPEAGGAGGRVGDGKWLNVYKVSFWGVMKMF